MYISISHTFYNQHRILPLHHSAWAAHPKDAVVYDLVDDGSPTPIPDTFRCNGLRVYRIAEDIRWNIAGARNLGFHVARTDWVLSADIDHIVTADALRKILQLDLSDPNRAYTFSRRREDGFVGCDAIINILMNKRRFLEIGGYDEDFSGNYGREETFFWHCIRYHGINLSKCNDIELEWHPKLGGTNGFPRDKTRNVEVFEEKISALRQNRYQNGKLLRFNWARRS